MAEICKGRDGTDTRCLVEAARQPGEDGAVLISGLAEDAGVTLFKKALLGFQFWEDPQQRVAALP